MRIIRVVKWVVFVLCFTSIQMQAQTNLNRFVSLQNALDSLSEDMRGLNGEVELSVSEIRLDELLRALALSHDLNLAVEEGLSQRVVGNFSQVRVKDVIVFLTKKYHLKVDFSGSILSISSYEELPEPPEYRPIDLQFDEETGFLSFDLRNDSLVSVSKKITLLTGMNLVVPRVLGNEMLTGFIKDVSLDEAIQKLALINELEVRASSSGIYVFEKPQMLNNNSPSNAKQTYRSSGELRVRVDSISDISLVAEGADLRSVVQQTFDLLGQDYMIFGDIEAQLTAELRHVHLDSLLDVILNASDYTYHLKQGIYFIGERKLEGLRDLQIVSIKHRSCVELSKWIPTEIKKEVFVQEMPELNALVLEGSKVAVTQIRKFITDIDRSVPVVMIEILIVDYIKSNGLDIGVEMGLTKEAVKTTGQFFPGINSTNGQGSINKLINAFEGFGALNVGSVVPNFYMNIKAMEQNGTLDIRSTPVLTTLNGQEASLSIGNTEYYVVETNNLIGTQNPQSQKTRNWKSVKAELGVKITPNISADNNVTLAIEVKQSNFTARIEPDAPPGQVSRTFNSLIRVKDGDMILLGGLEEIKNNDSGTGVPFLSRVPLLKWLFSKRIKDKDDKKLNLFIKPTIIN